MVQDLQAEDNRLHRLFEKFSSEARTISIASVALIISVLSLLMAWMAVYDASNAVAKVNYELQETQRLLLKSEDAADVASVRYANLLAYLKAKDIQIPEDAE